MTNIARIFFRKIIPLSFLILTTILSGAQMSVLSQTLPTTSQELGNLLGCGVFFGVSSTGALLGSLYLINDLNYLPRKLRDKRTIKKILNQHELTVIEFFHKKAPLLVKDNKNTYKYILIEEETKESVKITELSAKNSDFMNTLNNLQNGTAKAEKTNFLGVIHEEKAPLKAVRMRQWIN